MVKAKIVRIAEEVRREQFRPEGNAPYWSVGMCQFMSRLLEERLTAAGLTTQRIGGYYASWLDLKSGAAAGATESIATTWDGVWMHWWVECEGFVVDVAADRFQPANAGRKIVVVRKEEAPAYRAEPPVDEPAHGPGTPFEQ